MFLEMTVLMRYCTNLEFLTISVINYVCVIVGRNDNGQLGQGDTNRKDLPTEVPLLQGLNIVDACCGKNHTLFLTGMY